VKIEVEFFSQVSAIRERLWAECFRPPLEGLFWYSTLEHSRLDDQFTFRYGLVRVESRPVGIVPAFVHDVPIALVAPRPIAWALKVLARLHRPLGYQRTFFIGSPCSDEGTVGLLAGFQLGEVMEGIAAAAQAEAARLQARLVVFKDFPDAALAPAGFFPVVSYPGTVVALPAPDKAAYFRGLTHNQRHNFQKKLRRSKAELPLTTSIVDRPSDAQIEEILALFLQTYEKGTTKFERLGRAFFQVIRGREPVYFILQHDAEGALVSFMLVFFLGERVINKFIGIDYRRAGPTYLYFRLFEAALDFAYASGAKELQSGQTGYRAKLDLGHRLLPLTNFVRHQNPVLHALFRAIGTRVTWKSLDKDLANYLRAHPEADLYEALTSVADAE